MSLDFSLLVQELAKIYDVDNDGEISIAEFKQLLMSRNSPNKNNWLTVDVLTASDDKKNVVNESRSYGYDRDGNQSNNDKSSVRAIDRTGKQIRGVSQSHRNNADYNDNNNARTHDEGSYRENRGYDRNDTHNDGYDEYDDYNDAYDDKRNEKEFEYDDEPSSSSRALSNSSRTELNINKLKGSVNPDRATIEYECKMFLKKMKSILLKRAMDLRANNRIPKGNFALGEHSSTLFENLAKDLLANEFSPYVQRSDVRRGRKIDGKSDSQINYSGFNIVLKKFNFPGATPLGEDASRMLFESCKESSTNDNKINKNKNNDEMIDTNKFSNLIFFQGGDKITKFGFSEPVPTPSETGEIIINKILIISLFLYLCSLVAKEIFKRNFNFSLHDRNRSIVETVGNAFIVVLILLNIYYYHKLISSKIILIINCINYLLL